MIVTLATNKPVSKNLISKSLCEQILGSPSGIFLIKKNYLKEVLEKGLSLLSANIFLLFERLLKIAHNCRAGG
jgi:hypothetical protein